MPQLTEPREMILTAEAARTFRDWRTELEARRGDDLKPLENWGWGGKLDGLTLRFRVRSCEAVRGR